MRGIKTLAALLAVVLFVAGGAAQAGVILHEPFDYGGSDIENITGLGGSETGFLASEQWSNDEGDADYVAAGLSFSDLVTTGGKFNHSANGSRQTVSRGINVNQTGQIWGSYLWRPIANPGGGDVNGIMINNSITGNDNNSEFFPAGLGYNAGDKGEVRLNGGNKGSAQAGSVSQTNGNTHLILYTITNLGGGGGSHAMTQWMLTPDQFDNFKAGGLTDAELDAAALGSGPTNVLQRASRSGVGLGAAMTASDYLLIFHNGTTTADYDEIRMSDTSLDEATPIAVPQSVFYIGVDNGNNSDFDHENAADDHYYWENGDYSGLGTGGANWSGGQEIWKGGDAVTGFDRALTANDPTNYIYFQLDAFEAAADAQFSFVSDMVQPNGTHNLAFYMNGVLFHTETGIGTKFVTDTFTGADVGANAGSNVIEILRTGGPGGWTQFDYLSLEVVPGTAEIPEPATCTVLAAALAALGGYLRRRRRTA